MDGGQDGVRDDGRATAPRDVTDVLRRLATSPFRARFALGPADADYLRRRGTATVLRHARDFVTRRLAPARPEHDGRQTPWRGHPVFVAQHATATCCRGCLEKWHGIPQGRPLSDAEVGYVCRVIAAWLERQDVPPAADDGADTLF